MELYEVMRTTAAARAFTEEPVADAVLYRMLDHARFAPSGGNRQGWRVIKVDAPDLRLAIRDLYVLGWREYVAQLKQGFVPFAPTGGRGRRPAADLGQADVPERPDDFADSLHRVPVMLVLLADLSVLAVTDAELDRQSIVGGASIYPFAHNLLLAARNEGLGGVLTTILCRREHEVRQLLGFDEPLALAGLLVLGRPRRAVTKLSRRPVEAFCTIDRFDGPTFADPVTD